MATWIQGRAKCCREAGFTLLEVLVAVAIVAIALVMLLQLQGRSLDATIQAQDLTTAVLLAQTKMAALGIAPPAGEEQGTYDDPELKKFSWATAVTDHPLDLAGGVPVTVMQLVVTVYWTDGQQQRYYTLEGYAPR